MSVIPCSQDESLRKLIENYVETLKIEAHKLGNHGLDERHFTRQVFFAVR
jgi:hypothetical protein